MLNKSLDSIVSGFTKTLADLDAFIVSSNKKKDEKTAKIATLNTEVAGHIAEADKAATIRDNLAKLLG